MLTMSQRNGASSPRSSSQWSMTRVSSDMPPGSPTSLSMFRKRSMAMPSKPPLIRGLSFGTSRPRRSRSASDKMMNHRAELDIHRGETKDPCAARGTTRIRLSTDVVQAYLTPCVPAPECARVYEDFEAYTADNTIGYLACIEPYACWGCPASFAIQFRCAPVVARHAYTSRWLQRGMMPSESL